MNRYAKANTAEKANFTKFNKLISGFSVDHRELKGEKTNVKYIFVLKKNNAHIHSIEFGTKKGEVANIRLVVSRPTLKSDFYKALFKGKSEAKASYGGIVVTYPATIENAQSTLELVSKLNEASEQIELDPKRTYCDPPAGWVEGNDGKIGVTRGEKAAKEETPAEAPAEEPTAEVSAEEQAKADMELK